MKVKIIILLSLLTTIKCEYVSSKTNKQLDQALFVLERNQINKTFIFGKWTQEGGMENRYKYLGKITTNRGKTFKILNSLWIWGLSGRSTSRILIYDQCNKYLGNYYLKMDYNLPHSIIDNRLIFINNDEECDKNLKTEIDFRYGLPKQIFIKCNGDYGDVVTFE